MEKIELNTYSFDREIAIMIIYALVFIIIK